MGNADPFVIISNVKRTIIDECEGSRGSIREAPILPREIGNRGQEAPREGAAEHTQWRAGKGQ